MHVNRTCREAPAKRGIKNRFRQEDDLGSEEFTMLLCRNDDLLAEILKIVPRRYQLSGIDGE